MNTTNVLRAIDVDLNYLAHYNTKGSHWYRQGDGKRYQAHAKYAMGKPNPDAERETKSRPKTKREIELAKQVLYGRTEKERESARAKLQGSSSKSGVFSRALDKLRTAKATFDAKQDAAITAMRKGGVNTRGAQRIGMQRLGAQALGGIAGGIAAGLGANAFVNAHSLGIRKAGMVGGALGTKITGSKNLLGAMVKGGEMAVKGSRIAVPIIGTNIGANIGGAVSTKAFDTIVARGYAKRGQGSLKDRKVSDAYAKAYKDTYSKYLKEYSQKRANVFQPSYKFDNAVNKQIQKQKDAKAKKIQKEREKDNEIIDYRDGTRAGDSAWYTPKVQATNRRTKKK